MKILVLGDSMLDYNTYGVMNRICKEAPLPVFDELYHDYKPGGVKLILIEKNVLVFLWRVL